MERDTAAEEADAGEATTKPAEVAAEAEAEVAEPEVIDPEVHLAQERKREYNRLRQRRRRGTPAPAAKDEKTPAAKEAGVQKKKNDDMLRKRVERGNLHPAPRRAWGSVSGVEVDKASHLIYMSEDAQAARHRWAVESHADHLRHVL